MQPGGIIFDFDGVLVDSLGAHLDAWCSASTTLFGRAPENPRRLVGHATVAIARMIVKECGRAGSEAELIRLKSATVYELAREVKPFAGVPEVLAALAASDIPFGIASNAPRPFVEKVLEVHGLQVPVALGRGDAGRPKPAPDLYLACARALEISIESQRSTLVFEDSHHGLKAAIAAKMVPVGVTTQHDRHALLGAGALLTTPSVAEAFTTGVTTRSGDNLEVLGLSAGTL